MFWVALHNYQPIKWRAPQSVHLFELEQWRNECWLQCIGKDIGNVEVLQSLCQIDPQILIQEQKNYQICQDLTLWHRIKVIMGGVVTCKSAVWYSGFYSLVVKMYSQGWCKDTINFSLGYIFFFFFWQSMFLCASWLCENPRILSHPCFFFSVKKTCLFISVHWTDFISLPSEWCCSPHHWDIEPTWLWTPKVLKWDFSCFCTPLIYCLFIEQYVHILSVGTCLFSLFLFLCSMADQPSWVI